MSSKRPTHRDDPEDSDNSSSEEEEEEVLTPAKDPKAQAPAGDASNSSKKLFQRVWSENDEAVILQGMVDFAADRGSDPASNMKAFHDFIKDSIDFADSTREQLSDKVRRLKKKFHNNAAKKKYNPSKPIDVKVFQLSAAIWGSRPRPTATPLKPAAAAPLKPAAAAPLKPATDVSPVLVEALSSLPESLVRKGLSLVSAEQRADLEAKWKRIRIDEVELFAKRTRLLGEQASLVFDVLNK